MRKLLPVEQNLFPVTLKRKMEYEGHYIQEIVDKQKLKTFHQWYKRNNPHFKEMDLEIGLIDEFFESLRQVADATEKVTIISNPDNEIDNVEIEEVPLSRQYPTLLCEKYDVDTEENTVSNRLARLIVDYEISHKIPNDEVNYDDPELVPREDDFEAEELDDEVPKKKARTDEEVSRKKARPGNVSIAPGEMGKFKTFGDETYLEEKSFCNLFIHGFDGFLDINRKCQNKIGFAAYCRSRIKSIDPRFREDPTYIFFLQITKEKIEIKRSLQTYFRLARRNPGLTKQIINQVGAENLDKYNKRYSTFKNIRGTTMYYQKMKKDSMAFLRQLGAPTLFFTVSFAEFQDSILFHEVLETILDRKLTQEDVTEMKFTQTEKNKILCDNVIQTTIAFERRLQKIMKLLTNENFIITKSKKKMFVEDFFYRIEYQMRYV